MMYIDFLCLKYAGPLTFWQLYNSIVADLSLHYPTIPPLLKGNKKIIFEWEGDRNHRGQDVYTLYLEPFVL
jgi:hypothetical protein